MGEKEGGNKSGGGMGPPEGVSGRREVHMLEGPPQGMGTGGNVRGVWRMGDWGSFCSVVYTFFIFYPCFNFPVSFHSIYRRIEKH